MHAAILWYLLAAVVLGLDLLTKYWAEQTLHYALPVPVLPVLDWRLQYNPGAAFSFLSDAGGWQRWLFGAIAVSVSVVLVVWIARIARQQRLLPAALALILGGALGNLYDRLVLGHVVDFISVHYDNWYFPAFNLADSAITLGAILMLLDSFLGARRADDEVKPA